MPRPSVRWRVLRIAGSGALLLALAAFATPVAAAGCDADGCTGTGWLRLRTTGYLFQSVDEYGVTLDRFGGYQQFDAGLAGLAGGRMGLRISGRFADDLALKERVTDRSRLYVGHLELRPMPKLTARLGRQFVQEGPTGLTLDGLWLSARPWRLGEIRWWGGARAPLGRTFKSGNLDESAAWGARLLATCPQRRFRVGASFAYRERDGKVAARPLGLEGQLLRLPGVPGLRASGRVAYDLEQEAWDRAEALAQYAMGAGLPVLAAQIVDRRPAIDAGSYFMRFLEDEERIRVGRASVRYDHRSGFGGEAEWVGSFVDERTATRLGGALVFPMGRLGYSARVGDAGEESRWFGDVGYTVMPWLRFEAGATLLTYALLEDAPAADERDLTSAYGRLHLRPREGVGVVLELQDVMNPDVDHDLRFLAGLDLTASFGMGGYGLQPCGCAKTSGGPQR